MSTTVRLPLRVEEALARYCVERKCSKSEVIIGLLEAHLAAAESEKNPYELACEAGFIGAVRDADPQLSSQTRSSVRAAIANKHARA